MTKRQRSKASSDPFRRHDVAKIDGVKMPLSMALKLLGTGAVDGDVDLRYSGIQEFPSSTLVNGNLDLTDCRALVSLPDSLTVKGTLTLCGCTSLAGLPNGLTAHEIVLDHHCPRQCLIDSLGLRPPHTLRLV